MNLKTTITAILVLGAVMVKGQSKPKNHIYYDTVKTITERVDYSPDTIPVYFKEIVEANRNIDNSVPDEQWRRGYVIWQTYRKNEVDTTRLVFSNGINAPINYPEYYKSEYPEHTFIVTNTFLYEDKKTVVTRKVIYSIKQ